MDGKRQEIESRVLVSYLYRTVWIFVWRGGGGGVLTDQVVT